MSDGPLASDEPTRPEARPESDSGEVRRVLLVGFMGSGKTSVGKELARRLGWPFIDFDQAVERQSGLRIDEIFERRGEAGFRALEEQVGRRLLTQDDVVLATGGGWPARAGRMEEVPAQTFTVWLRVTAETALARVKRQGTTRPLLEGADPLADAEGLLASRAPYYGKAELTLDTEGATVASLAGLIVEALGSSPPQGKADSITVAERGS